MSVESEFNVKRKINYLLFDMDRGQIDSLKTKISSLTPPQLDQCWDYVYAHMSFGLSNTQHKFRNLKQYIDAEKKKDIRIT